MTSVIKFPNKPLIEVYDIARKELADAVYSKARLGGEIEKTLQDKVNEFIDALMTVEKGLERGARDGFFRELFVSEFERARTLGALVRLRRVIEGFLEATGSQSQGTASKDLPGQHTKALVE